MSCKQIGQSCYNVYKTGFVAKGEAIELLRNCRYLFIDEILQVSAAEIAYIDYALRIKL